MARNHRCGPVTSGPYAQSTTSTSRTRDSKLRGCDLVALRVDDVAPNGYADDRATVRQRKTGRPVRFELTETTRQALDDYLRFAGRTPGDHCSGAARLPIAP